MDQPHLARIWQRRAATLAGRLNFAWWLERFNALLLVVLGVAAVVLLTLRTMRPEILEASRAGWIAAVLLPALALGAWSMARRRFVDARAGLVRLEDRLSLHNGLSAAAAGQGPWPELPGGDWRHAAFRWNAFRAGFPSIAALALLALAWWVPLPARGPSVAAPKVEPGAWEQMEDWLETLQEEDLIAEEKIEQIESKIEELRERPEDEWFSHSSLEATDTLRESLATELQEIANELAKLERAMNSLQSFGGEMSDAAREQLVREYEEALEALQNSGMGVNEELLRQLGGIDPSKLGKETTGNLTAEQMKQLQQQLGQAGGALGSMEGLPGLGGEMMAGQPGLGEGFGEGFGEGQLPGQGGVTRGRGDAPLQFGEKESNLGTANLEQIKNEDLSRATLGEVLGLGETEREIDESATGPASAGSIRGAGKGGDAVSRQSLLPGEQAVLKRYFK